MSFSRQVIVLFSLCLGSGLLEAAPLNVELVAAGLDRPIGLAHAGDGTGRLFIMQQEGQILIFDGSEVLPQPFLDLSSLVSCCGERGLLGLAFHPDYETNGFFYVNYTDSAGDTVVARYAVSADPDLADPGSGVILLTIEQPFSNHNGGHLAFGPEGNLWIAAGDGGSAGDPMDHAQDGGTLLGKLLRIDVDGAFPYAIPADNPFASDPGTRDEIWAVGLRNPWRFSFDRLTGDLFIGDVGQADWEEINFEPATSDGGLNYGWRLMEGNHCFNPSSGCNDGSLQLPIFEYSHSLGCSVTGGFRYRGAEMPEHIGTYFFGDYCSGRIWGTSNSGDGTWTTVELLDTTLSISSFGEDERGELYVVDLNGGLYRLLGSTICQVTLNRANYSDGDTVTLTSLSLANLGTTPVPVELKIWIRMAELPPQSVVNAGSDGSVSLPAGFSDEQGPVDLFTVTSEFPRGSYEFGCRFLDPVTGALVTEDVAGFLVQ